LFQLPRIDLKFNNSATILLNGFVSFVQTKIMRRRDFFLNTSLATVGIGISPLVFGGSHTRSRLLEGPEKTAKNIIFLVSDGMSAGTLNMADLMSQRQLGRSSYWVDAYRTGLAKRAMMDTASADSLVTDSAASGSAWGGGVRVNNGRINWGENGEQYTPILQKFKQLGKAVGCVTTVPITHATPASFCVCNEHRRNQPEMAKQYLDLRFDVMLGGGKEYFDKTLRSDGEDVFGLFEKAKFGVAKTKKELEKLRNDKRPVLGVFHESALPFTIDQNSVKSIEDQVPTIQEMTQFAINKLKNNPEGFVLQIEGGRVDWAAHSNDTTGLIFDQIAFDEAVKIALDFAEKDGETLVIITTDHGNGNPGLFYGKKANVNFDNLQNAKHSNDWILQGEGFERTISVQGFIERVQFAQNIVLEEDEAKELVTFINALNEKDFKNEYKLPFERLAQIQKKYTSVGWGDMNHSADFVELAMAGPGSEMLTPFVNNYELHNFMLVAAGVGVE
jgi:alkaline phosphatase